MWGVYIEYADGYIHLDDKYETYKQAEERWELLTRMGWISELKWISREQLGMVSEPYSYP